MSFCTAEHAHSKTSSQFGQSYDAGASSPKGIGFLPQMRGADAKERFPGGQIAYSLAHMQNYACIIMHSCTGRCSRHSDRAVRPGHNHNTSMNINRDAVQPSHQMVPLGLGRISRHPFLDAHADTHAPKFPHSKIETGQQVTTSKRCD